MKKRGTPVCTRNKINNYFNKLAPCKRSQAFLITAIIFIAIISTFITIKNYSKKTEFSTFSYVAEEIQIESEKVMDYSLINRDDVIEDFTKKVSVYVDKDTKIYFITDASCYNYINNIKTTITCNMNQNSITATIDGTNYDFFKYSQGKYFYFIMIKEKEVGGEKHVYTNA